MSCLLSAFFVSILIQISNCRIVWEEGNYIVSSAKKDESILYSCFINNAETEVIIHDPKPKHFKNKKNIDSLHEGISLAISTFACHQYTHLNFTFSLQLIKNLYHENGGFKIYKNGKLENDPNFKKRYRSFLGDVAVFEYMDKTSSPKNIKQGTVSLTFLGDISNFNQENKADHLDLYKCQSFAATIWTHDILYEIKPIPTISASPICKTMTLSAIPTNKLYNFSRNSLNHLMINHINNQKKSLQKRELLETDASINVFDCAQSPYNPKWENQWQHHHTVKIGLVIDKGMYDEMDSSDDLLDEYIAQIYANTNGLFSPQLNIHIAIGDVFVAENIPNYDDLSNPWWLDCNLQNNQYPLMQDWNEAKWNHDKQNCLDAGYDEIELKDCPYIDSHAAFLLISTCHGGSGVAEIGKLCKTGTDSSAAVNHKIGRGDLTWLTFIHELGHLFGAIHHFDGGNGGVMDYGAQKYQSIHQFRNYVDICYGIAISRDWDKDTKPNCWETYDYVSGNFKWIQTGDYSSCNPPCSNFQNKVELVKCILFEENGNFSTIVDDENCGLELKPLAKFEECQQSEYTLCPISNCGNYKWEMDEQCDIALMDNDEEIINQCCQNNCTWKISDQCKGLKKQIDAAFTDSNGKLYLFQGRNFSVYSNIGDAIIGSPDIGYPKSIRNSFPINSWNSDFDAAFCTSDDIVYIFKDFSYIRIDLGAINIVTGNAQIDASPIPIITRSHDFEFGFIPRELSDCGRIDAAFIHSFDKATIVCGSLYYSWKIASTGFDNMYRPFFSDYNIDFGDVYSNYYKIDAASYIWQQNIIRFFAGNVYVDYMYGKQSGKENKLQSMGYCTENCQAYGSCPVRHNNLCYDSSYLLVIQFEGLYYNGDPFDKHHFDDDTNIQYETNGGVFEGSNAVVFDIDSKITLKIPSLMYTIISKWKMSIWLYPTTQNDEQDFFHIINKDDSHLVFILNTNSKCSHDTQLTVTVEHKNANGVDEIVFQDINCVIPITVNTWNKLTFNAVPYMVSVAVNSRVQESTVIESIIDLTIELQSWHLGMNYIGKIDYFIFQQTDGFVIKKDGKIMVAACLFPFVDNVLEMAAWMTAFLAVYTMVMWALYKYYGARVLLDHIARRFNMEQEQQAFNNNDNNNINGQIEMVPPQQVEEVAAGMAVQVLEQAFSGNATPFGSPVFQSPVLKSPVIHEKPSFLSPQRILFQHPEQYNGNVLPSPAKQSPYKLSATTPDTE